jgi:nucleoside-diphosphate-sugar epimerase
MHTDDVAEAYRLVALSAEARGAYNVAADPVIDAERFAEVLGTRVVPVPGPVAKLALDALWRMHVVPAEPPLFDLLMGLPLMDTTRLRDLGWSPRVPADDALREVLVGMADHAGANTPSQTPDGPAGRADEVATGVGERSTPEG